MTGLARLDQPHFLIRLANDELEIGVREARTALNDADDWGVAEGHYRTAKEAYTEAVHLIALVKKTQKEGQSEVETKLEQLREMLVSSICDRLDHGPH